MYSYNNTHHKFLSNNHNHHYSYKNTKHACPNNHTNRRCPYINDKCINTHRGIPHRIHFRHPRIYSYNNSIHVNIVMYVVRVYVCVGGGYKSWCVFTKQTLLRLPPTHHPKAPFAETSSFRAWEERKRLVSLTTRTCTMRIMRAMSIRGHYKLYIRLTAP